MAPSVQSKIYCTASNLQMCTIPEICDNLPARKTLVLFGAAVKSNNGWIIADVYTPFFNHRSSTRTIFGYLQNTRTCDHSPSSDTLTFSKTKKNTWFKFIKWSVIDGIWKSSYRTAELFVPWLKRMIGSYMLPVFKGKRKQWNAALAEQWNCWNIH